MHYIKDFVKSGFHHIYLPVILNTCLPRGTVPNRILVPCRCHPYRIPPIKVGHATRVYDPYSFQIVMCLFFKSHKNKSVKVLWDETYGFSSLSEKTRKSNHLKISLPRLHFLLSQLKGLCHPHACASQWKQTWKSRPDFFKFCRRFWKAVFICLNLSHRSIVSEVLY